MRYGKSVFLGLVPAEIADHGDCSRFQVCCPVCSEALFKGVLTRRDRRETHYFSHHREVPSEQAERCELRVSSIIPQQVEKARAEARGQALAVFVGKYRECVLRGADDPLRTALASAGFGPLRVAIAAMERRATWRRIAVSTAEALRAAGRSGQGMIEQTRQDAVSLAGESAAARIWSRNTPFYAAGMLSHALTPGGYGAWRSLMSAAAVMTWFRYHSGLEVPWLPILTPDFRSRRTRFFAEIISANDGKLAKALRAANDATPMVPGYSTLYDDLMNEVILGTVGALLVVPYEDILRETIGRTERPRRGAG